ncbi:hypothetical protein AA98_1253 [Escherichia coli 2-011-08_S1_C1]|nr:hypothetical protein AA98_1253 [Escherichia coli 2-011-08_S1_C1]
MQKTSFRPKTVFYQPSNKILNINYLHQILSNNKTTRDN